jgi:hypothetical protein
MNGDRMFRDCKTLDVDPLITFSVNPFLDRIAARN